MHMDNEKFRIEVISHENIGDINRTDTTFEISSILVPYLENGEFRYTIEKLQESRMKTYEEDDIDHTSYIDNPDKTVYLVYVEGEIAGQVIMNRNWNLFVRIEDIRVGTRYRRTGIGTRLIEKTIEWATAGGMPGIMVETQDNNVKACMFYENNGFILGGVDRKLYGAGKYAHETALFWYLTF